jgi:predicted O-methyltransferase YrrM
MGPKRNAGDIAGSVIRPVVRRVVPEPVRGPVRERLKARAQRNRPQDLVPAADLQRCFSDALALLREKAGSTDVGDYLEFGVYYGSSTLSMWRALTEGGFDGVRLFGFDSFEGLPESAAHEDGGEWAPGQFAMSERRTRRRLMEEGVDPSRLHLVPGWFDDTATDATARRLGIERAGVVLVDCDLYSSTRTALAFVHPRLSRHTVLLFDDWTTSDLHEKDMGEKRAFEEWLEEHPELEASPLPDYGRNSRVFLVERHDVASPA